MDRPHLARALLPAIAFLVLAAAAMPGPAGAFTVGTLPPPSPLRVVSDRHPLHRHHHAVRPVEGQPSPPVIYGQPSGDPAAYSGPVPPGGFYNPEVNNGSSSQFAPNDPERPYGANSTITAPPGTAAAEEQEINRRNFCNYAPEHC